MKRIILGTSNDEKVHDLILALKLYAPYLLSRNEKNVITLKDVRNDYINIEDADENGSTVEENCMAKLTYYKSAMEKIPELQGSMLISEDTGMFVRALDWSPGVHTARFAGDHDWNKLNCKVIDMMYGIEDRHAFIKTAVGITIVGAGEDTTKMDSKIVYGNITESIYDGSGYAFDKIFRIEGRLETVAEMSSTCNELRACELPRGMCMESLVYNSNWMRRIHNYMKI